MCDKGVEACCAAIYVSRDIICVVIDATLLYCCTAVSLVLLLCLSYCCTAVFLLSTCHSATYVLMLQCYCYICAFRHALVLYMETHDIGLYVSSHAYLRTHIHEET